MSKGKKSDIIQSSRQKVRAQNVSKNLAKSKAVLMKITDQSDKGKKPVTRSKRSLETEFNQVNKAKKGAFFDPTTSKY